VSISNTGGCDRTHKPKYDNCDRPISPMHFSATQKLHRPVSPVRARELWGRDSDRLRFQYERVCQSGARTGIAATCTATATRARSNTAETGDESVTIWLQCPSAEWSPSLVISPFRKTDLDMPHQMVIGNCRFLHRASGPKQATNGDFSSYVGHHGRLVGDSCRFVMSQQRSRP
jgi:hypothetical protein